jgi:hypothetical protein
MSVFYNNGKGELFKANIDLESDIINLAFMATSYTPDIDAHGYWSDISSSLASGTSVQTLGSKTVTVDNTNNRAEFDAANVSIAGVTAETDKFVLYKNTGVAATSQLICCIDIAEGTLRPIGGTLGINFNAEGIFAI